MLSPYSVTRARCALATLVALATACSSPQLAVSPPPVAAPAAVTHATPPTRDPALYLPADAHLVLTADLATLRALPRIHAVWDAFVRDEHMQPSLDALRDGCGPDVLADIDAIATVIGTPGEDRDLVVLRTPLAPPEAHRCVEALVRSLGGTGSPFGMDDADAYEAPVDPHDPQGESLLYALRDGLLFIGDRPAVERALGESALSPGPDVLALRGALPAPAEAAFYGDARGLERALAVTDGPLAEMLRGQTRIAVGGRFSGTPVLALVAEAPSPDVAEQGVTALRTSFDEVAGAANSLEFNFPQDLPSVVRVPRAVVRDALSRVAIRAEGARVRVAVDVPAATDPLALMVTTYLASAPETAPDSLRNPVPAEAASNLAYLARMATLYVSRARPAGPRGRVPPPAFPPSAPLTPGAVPRGTEATDPAGTWQHPTWQALTFSLSHEHRFAYQWISAGTGAQATFTARAVGDLDGDGQTVTYELAGHLNASLEVEHDAQPRRVGPED